MTDSWCYHCERFHGPMDWHDGCQDADQHGRFQRAWRQEEAAERDLRWWRWRAGRLRRWTVCWWKHRTSRVSAGVYLSRSCWACADPQQDTEP